MAHRMITWDNAVPVEAIEWLPDGESGGSGTNTAQSGLEVPFKTVGHMRRFRLDFSLMQDQAARSYRGLIAGGEGGVNYYRMLLVDAHRRRSEYPPAQWESGVEWEDGYSWGTGFPLVKTSLFLPAGSTVIRLTNQFWGYSLQRGEFVGFNHYGVYEITDVYSNGQYRITPPLATSVSATTGYCTLMPMFAARLVP